MCVYTTISNMFLGMYILFQKILHQLLIAFPTAVFLKYLRKILAPMHLIFQLRKRGRILF